MVLPAGAEVKIFGWAQPDGGPVQVQFGEGDEFSAEIDPESWWWEVTLPPMEASMAPVEIVVNTTLDSITLTDVVFGDLYMCVGASNVDMSVEQAVDAAAALKEAETFGDRVRIINVKQQEGEGPSENFVPKHGWQQVQNDNNTANFSALCYFFGLEQISRHNETPVGMIQASWGATSVVQWAPREALEECYADINETAGPGNYEQPRSSSVLWYGMMSPWRWLNVKGLVLNLQGAKCVIPFMIQKWREAWVEKGNDAPAVAAAQFGCNTGHKNVAIAVSDTRWAEMHYLESDRTVLVSTSDLCDPASPYAIMHSPFKREEAARLAEALEVFIEDRPDMPDTFPVPTAVFADPWDDSWGPGAWDDSECKARAWGIRVEFDQDIFLKPEFKTLHKRFSHINGFALYPAIESRGWEVPIKLALTEIRGNTVMLNTTLSTSENETEDPWPGVLLYADGGFPVMPLTNSAGQPVGSFKVDVPFEPGILTSEYYSLHARGRWSPATGRYNSYGHHGWKIAGT
jgi:sialate O-acetylesterase